ncbi:MAG: multifunctional CCA addition/repair protein, partial [Betaproteobacteria bacterium]|nr:multifunctional CCA addition/repair protein [Betaproteobacteria bacterium]
MKIYRVGGSVRDELLGRPIADRDWVIVGATPEILLASGYKPVGRDFPVFLHPETREEYALARTERKHGRGYRGFEFFASPDVTLEEDLARRDLTINAMARAEDGTLIDPFGGAEDLRTGVLRHVSPAFAEDPLRVLRVARFAARFGFCVAPATEALMRALAASGELAELSPERVWQELATGLMEPQPSRLLAVLRTCGALAQVLPEVDALYGVPQPVTHHPEVDTGVHVARALDYAARHGFALPVRYAILAHDLGKAESPQHAWPKHYGHEARSARLAERMSARLKVPAECFDAARLAAKWHGIVHRAAELRPATLLDLLLAADALRRPGRLDGLLAACQADAQSRPGRGDDYAPERIVRDALAVVKHVDAAKIAGAIAAKRLAGQAAPSDAIAKALRAARLKALQQWRA